MTAPQIKAGLVVAASVSLSVSQAKIFFVRFANTAMKMNGDSTTGRNTFTARQWVALIGFCGVETRKQVQKNWEQIEKACDATELHTIVVTSIQEQQVDVDRHSSQVWFRDDVAEDIWKCRFTYGPMANMEKLSGAYRLLFSSVGPHRKFGI